MDRRSTGAAADEGTARFKDVLYVHALPVELSASLEPAAADALVRAEIVANPISDAQPPVQEEAGGGLTCTACGALAFASVDEQRVHAKSDYHRFNLQRKQRSKRPVSLEEFEQTIDRLSASISGSESTEDDGDSDADGKPRQAAVQGPVVWFTSALLPSHVTVGIYRVLLSEKLEVASLQSIQYITMFMLGGGHFAGMVVRLVPGGPHFETVVHKSFHRYTTRRKQGGGQSSHDASKGAAHSAGSSLRRYNETALIRDIQQLFVVWQHNISKSDHIFVRAIGHSSRSALFGNNLLQKNDRRIHKFPFTTRRATFKELNRCLHELFRVKLSQVSECALAELNVPARSNKPALTTEEQETIKRLQAEAEARQIEVMHSSTVVALTRRSKIPALSSYLQQHQLSPQMYLVPADNYSHAPTLLHVAASQSQPVAVSFLLEAGADPAQLNVSGKTPFDLAGDRATRDAFRVARYELGEIRYNWAAAHVPSSLSRTDVEERVRQEKDAEEKAALERLHRQQEQTDIDERKPITRRGLGGINASVAVRPEQGLPPEMRQKIEREKRARAAEARLGMR